MLFRSEVFERPASAFVARFMGDHNVISGAVTAAGNGVLDIAVPGAGSFSALGSDLPLGSPAAIAIRTDHVRLGVGATSGLGFTGTVSNVEYRGGTVKLSIEGAGVDDFTAIVDDVSFFRTPVSIGDAVSVHWEAADAIVLGRPD